MHLEQSFRFLKPCVRILYCLTLLLKTRMQEIRNILVAVDFSESSMNALDTAMHIAARHQSKVYILNVIDKSLDFGLNADEAYVSDSSIVNNAGNILNALAASLYKAHQILPAILLTEGFVFAEILKAAIQNRIELIVMGSHGASGYREFFIGSNTYNVFKNAHCPVLTIPPQKKWRQFKNVLYPVRPVSGALTRLDLLSGIVHQDQNQLNVLGLSYRKNEEDKNVLAQMISEMEEKYEHKPLNAKAIYNGRKNVAEDVLETSLQTSADLIVITPSLDITYKHFFVGPNMQRIINQAKVPVLSLKRIASPAYSL